MNVERASIKFVGQWVLASIMGWIGGMLVGQGTIFWVIHPIERAMGLAVVSMEGLVGIGVTMAAVGTGVGIMQWLILRRQFSHGGWWVLASTMDR